MDRTKTWVWCVAAAAATAAMLWFGDGLMPCWPLMWFAPLPVLLLALRVSWPAAALAAFAAWLAASGNLWGYLHRLGLPFAGWLAIFGTVALVAAVSVLLFRALVLRGAVWSGIVAFPAVWVVLEYVRNLTTPHGTAGSVAYTQLGFLPFLQLASVTGPWGMSFLLLLFPAALACAIHLRSKLPRLALRIVAITSCVFGAVLLYGWARLATSPHEPMVRVGLAASDLPENENVAASGADAQRLLASYAAQARQLIADGAQVVVLPEKLAVMRNADVAATDVLFQQIADASAATIVVGVLRDTGLARYNQARVYEPHAVAAQSYNKEHMLPPFESPLTPGRSLVTIESAGERTGVAICKDMDFAGPAERYGREATGLMLVPAWDFQIDRVWHGHIAVMRGVEYGFSLARAAKGGFLTISDSRGRILAERRSNAAPFATLLASAPAAHSATLYLHWGDWFAWVCCVLLGLALARAAGFPGKPRP